MRNGDKLGNTRPQAGEADEAVSPTFENTTFGSVARSGKPRIRTVSLGSGELLAAGRFANRPDPKGRLGNLPRKKLVAAREDMNR